MCIIYSSYIQHHTNQKSEETDDQKQKSTISSEAQPRVTQASGNLATDFNGLWNIKPRVRMVGWEEKHGKVGFYQLKTWTWGTLDAYEHAKLLKW